MGEDCSNIVVKPQGETSGTEASSTHRKLRSILQALLSKGGSDMIQIKVINISFSGLFGDGI